MTEVPGLMLWVRMDSVALRAERIRSEGTDTVRISLYLRQERVCLALGHFPCLFEEG
jgi:hypothetical protein